MKWYRITQLCLNPVIAPLLGFLTPGRYSEPAPCNCTQIAPAAQSQQGGSSRLFNTCPDPTLASRTLSGPSSTTLTTGREVSLKTQRRSCAPLPANAVSALWLLPEVSKVANDRKPFKCNSCESFLIWAFLMVERSLNPQAYSEAASGRRMKTASRVCWRGAKQPRS